MVKVNTHIQEALQRVVDLTPIIQMRGRQTTSELSSPKFRAIACLLYLCFFLFFLLSAILRIYGNVRAFCCAM